MRTQLSIVVVAAGIVGTITAGTVSANVLMDRMSGDTAAMTAAPAANSKPVSSQAETVLAPAAAPAKAPVSKTVVGGTTSAAKAAAKVAGRPAATRKTITYVVKSGDDLSSIAQWFALHGYADLFRANRAVIGSNPDLIFPGQRITISGGTMTVR